MTEPNPGRGGAPSRVVLYARYSSDQQRDASIDDQLRVCRARAEREGWTVVAAFHDAAVSGATALRPGYQALLAALRGGVADIVLAESLDRFSRDQEHLAQLHKHALYAGVRIVTLSEGEVGELHVGLKGTMGALFLKDLADKTRRGLEGRVRAGRSAGQVVYGYRAVRRLGPDGEPERGLREPDPAEAAVVRRIFADYAAGASPMRIARALNAEGVPAPNGGGWNETTIRGRPSTGRGLLRNPIYIGRLVWNRFRTVRDPLSGKGRQRVNRLDERVEQEVPGLRLVPEELWERVQARLAADAAPQRQEARDDAVPSQVGIAFWERRRPKHLLTGKVVCGACGAQFEARGRDYLACRQVRRGLCHNHSRVRRGPLQARVLEALGRRLMAPELVEAFVREFTAEWNRLAREAEGGREARRRELAAVEGKLANLVDAIADGLRAAGLQARLDALEARRRALVAELEAEAVAVPRLHPNIALLYRERVVRLEAALAEGRDAEALEAARELIDKVVVHPPGDGGGGPGLELIGHLAAMLRAGGVSLPREGDAGGADVLGLFERSVKGHEGGQSPLPRTSRATPAPSPPPRPRDPGLWRGRRSGGGR